MISNAKYFKQYLYKMTFPNGMVYIGTAYDIHNRWANRGAGYRSQRVWAAIKEFGWENIEKEIVLHIPLDKKNPWRSSDEIRKRERELIKEYGSRSYNFQCTEAGNEFVTEKTRASGVYERNRKK